MIFKNVFVINLKKDTERLAKISQQLYNFNIPFTRIEGVNGQEINPDNYNMKTNITQIIKGAIGCGLSHRKVWSEIVNQNLDYGIILEDDSVITPRILSLPKIPENWDIVYIGHAKNSWPRNTCSSIPIPAYDYNGKKGPIMITPNVMKFINYDESPMGLWGYALTRTAAQKLLSMYDLQVPVDVFIVSNLDKFNVYGILPVAIKHCYSGGSNIDKFVFHKNLSPIKIKTNVKKILIFSLLCILILLLYLYKKKKIRGKIIIILLVILLVILGYLLFSYLNLFFVYDNYSTSNDPFDIWSLEEKEKALKLLNITINIFDKNNIKHSITYGTLLGWRRNGKILPWDDDIDLMISDDDEIPFTKLKVDFEKHGIIMSEKNQKIGCYKLYWKDGAKIFGNNKHTFPFIDIFPIIPVQNINQLTTEKMYMLKDFQVFRSKLEGIDVNIPVNADIFLDIWYKDWRKKCHIGKWSHKYEISKENITVDCRLLFK